jgi:hypothetical protein
MGSPHGVGAKGVGASAHRCRRGALCENVTPPMRQFCREALQRQPEDILRGAKVPASLELSPMSVPGLWSLILQCAPPASSFLH